MTRFLSAAAAWGAALGLALSLALTAAPLQAKNYNMVTNLSQMQPQGQMVIKTLGDIEKLTEGRIALVWHDAGDILPVNMHLNAVASGSVPAAFTAFAYFGGTLPVLNIYSGFPFSPGIEAWTNWLFHGDGLAILQESLTPLNIVAIPMQGTPREGGGFFNKEIKSPADFKGLRFRIGGWGGEVAARLGAAISQIPANELYLAMDRGRIDAMEFSSPSIDLAWGFDKLAKYYYFPGWHQPVGMEWLLVNKQVWDGWSEADRAVLMEQCKRNFVSNYYDLLQADLAAVAVMDENPALTIERFPPEVLDALRGAWHDVLSAAMQKNPAIKKAYESFAAFTASERKLADLQALAPDALGK